jgi:hypothetical protein
MTCSRTPSCNARSSRCERPQPLCQVASPAPHARAMSRVQRFIAGLCHVTDDVATVSTISLGTAISAWCKAQSVELSMKKLRGNSTYKSGPPAPSCAPCRIPTAFALNRPQEQLLGPASVTAVTAAAAAAAAVTAAAVVCHCRSCGGHLRRRCHCHCCSYYRRPMSHLTHPD